MIIPAKPHRRGTPPEGTAQGRIKLEQQSPSESSKDSVRGGGRGGGQNHPRIRMRKAAYQCRSLVGTIPASTLYVWRFCVL